MDKKSIKLPDGYYWDSSSLVHEKLLLKNIMTTDVLYDSMDGSVSSVTLKENATDYQYLILELTPKQYTGSLGIDYAIINPSNSSFSKSILFYSTNNQVYGFSFRYTISNKTITINNNQAGTVGAGTAYWGNGNVYAITKVLGVNKVITN